MLKRCPRGFAMIFEDQNVLKAAVLLKVDNAVTKCPEHVFNALVRHVGKSLAVIRGLNDHLMSANAVHAVVHAVGATIKATLNAKCGILIGNYPY